MIVTQYRITTICDTCGKQDVRTSDSPAGPTVSADWVQAAPPGTTDTKQFCSLACLSKWENPAKPWAEKSA